ncbi:uncharacterized protein LOC142972621 isoform X2 [Anticarsia gemmatalis]|uniref:uncharacterized protein LOC142972621 isoform X2 n=1 Tax=Anticarsia gemmatalis TaxID=129554 RepID=UPI003F760A68
MSLAISLAIVLVITGSARCFTISRLSTVDTDQDMAPAGSTLHEVRYNIQAQNIQAIENAPDNGSNGVIALNANTQSIPNDITSTAFVHDTDTRETIEDKLNVTDMKTTVSLTATTINIPAATTIAEVDTAVTEAKTSNADLHTEKPVNESNIDVTHVSTTQKPYTTEEPLKLTSEKETVTSPSSTTAQVRESESPKLEATQNVIITTDTTTASLTIPSKETQEDLKPTSSEINDTVVSDKDNDTRTSETVSEIPEVGLKANINVAITTTTVPHTDTTPVEEVTVTTEIATTNKTYAEKSTEISTETTFTTEFPTTTEVKINIDNELTPNSQYDFETTEVEANPPETIVTTLPPWKVYKTIDRKRTTSSEETTTLDSMTRAETGRIILEKVLNNTPIPSLEELKNDLLNAQEFPTTRLETTIATETIASNSPGLNMTTPTQATVETVENKTPKIEAVFSKRAGYIDNTETTSMQPEKVVATTKLNDIPKHTESFATVDEAETADFEAADVPESKNGTGRQSQSQLDEDAMKEELLMEKTLNENAYIARHRETTPAEEQKNSHTTPNIVTEDMLSVKPINNEKKKNGLYDNSSYKPLKKLDVQPSKQFVRDPDDNSWRNESISSLGIVFKPKNASKSFTEVLKNKTTELSNLAEKIDKDSIPDLRVRLEKIAEVRKSKKKRINKFGDTVYSDYEENSGENLNLSKEETTSPMIPVKETEQLPTTTQPPSPPSSSPAKEIDLSIKNVFIAKENKEETTTPVTTKKSKNVYNLGEYYDTTDEYDTDYITLPKIDLKKFTMPFKTRNNIHISRRPSGFTTRPMETPVTKPMGVTYLPDRQPTVQYFPPTKKTKPTTTQKQKVNVNDYDADFRHKLDLFSFKDGPKDIYGVSYVTTPPVQAKKLPPPSKTTKPQPLFTSFYETDNLDKNLYLTNQPHVTETQSYVTPDGNYNRASYVIKHYRDFINEAAKGSEEDKQPGYLPFTEAPIQGVTMNDIGKFNAMKVKPDDDYDYDTHFRKDILNRFVDNFNQNSERFKVDFPILYNNSVVHRKVEENGKVLASSSAFMKRLYESGNQRPCDHGNCDNMSIELAPAYELHYYVPDQEEKEEVEPRSSPVPYRFRL